MSYAPPSEESFRAAALDAYRGVFPGADISTSSEIYGRASLVAAAAALMSHGIRSVEDQIFPATADTTNVERHAGLYDLQRKQPTAATDGSVVLGGTPAGTVSAGLTLFHADGTEFVTTSGGTFNTYGFVTVGMDAVTAGAAGNRIGGDELQVLSPPVGVDAEANVAGDLSGGTDQETNAALAARVEQRKQLGNAGGTQADYEQWALTVDGTIAADCLPTRLGPGTVTVAVYSLGGSGYRAPAGSALRAAVLAYLDTKRPVTASVDVPAITETSVDVTVDDLDVEPGFDPGEVKAAVEVAIVAHIYGRITNELMYRTQLGRAIASVPGVRDYTLTTPSTSTVSPGAATDVSVLVPGTVTVNLA